MGRFTDTSFAMNNIDCCERRAQLWRPVTRSCHKKPKVSRVIDYALSLTNLPLFSNTNWPSGINLTSKPLAVDLTRSSVSSLIKHKGFVTTYPLRIFKTNVGTKTHSFRHISHRATNSPLSNMRPYQNSRNLKSSMLARTATSTEILKPVPLFANLINARWEAKLFVALNGPFAKIAGQPRATRPLICPSILMIDSNA